MLSSWMATEVEMLPSSGKEADVYLVKYKGAPLVIEVYRLYALPTGVVVHSKSTPPAGSLPTSSM